MTIRVIGAGFGRTGTTSLKVALEMLGFAKCYHMIEVMKHPDDARVWIDAARGRPVDWDTLFTGYQATVDWPGCTFYETLMARYPDAKVILTVRDPQKWHRSAMQTIYGTTTFPMSILRPLIPRMRTAFQMQNEVFWQRTFHGRFADKDYAIRVFDEHNEAVKRSVPPERLLVYDVKEGWEPLCRFLDVPVPLDQPFPHLNDTRTFRRRIRIVRWGFTAVILALSGAAGIAWRMLGRAGHPETN